MHFHLNLLQLFRAASLTPALTPTRPLLMALILLGLPLPHAAAASLLAQPATALCGAATPARRMPPPAAAQRVPQSEAVAGTRDIAWVWFGSPTPRYPHAALGTALHAASLHVVAADGSAHVFTLPANRVFEDRVPRLVDLDGDGHDEIVVVEADSAQGAALVVYGLQSAASSPLAATPGSKEGATAPAATPAALREIARSPPIGQPLRWLNPAGIADFDGHGQLEIASVTTPHIGGLLTLYAYRPPLLVPQGTPSGGVSNHRLGTPEQQLAAVLNLAGSPPVLLLPDSDYRSLRALAWTGAAGANQWHPVTPPLAMRAVITRVARLGPNVLPNGAAIACVQLIDASWWRVTLAP